MYLKARDWVEYTPRRAAEPEVCTDLTVVYEDADFLVVDKPANLPCHPAGRYFQNTLWALIRDAFDLEVVHQMAVNRPAYVMT